MKQNTWRKRKLQIIKNVRSNFHQSHENERKSKKSEPQRNKKISQSLARQEKSPQRNKQTGLIPLVRYSEPVLNWTTKELRKMDQRTMKLRILLKVL